MKKIIILSTLFIGGSLALNAQSAIDGFRISQPDLKGTARYMSMAGAFGALGGDLSSITQNPGGIGVYRSSDVGFTLDLDLQSANSKSMGISMDMNQTKFLLNNLGGVFTLRLPSSACPNLNFGFVYNKTSSFNRKYGGSIPQLSNSMSNYIAGIANSEYIPEGELISDNYYDPYNPGAYEYAPPWLAILGYDSYLISPESYSDNGDHWVGQWGNETRGKGEFMVEEWGSLNDYNIILGGNISNVVYWGMNFDIINLDYSINAIWGENLVNAYLPSDNGGFFNSTSNWNLNNIYNVSGTGFQYQLGVIVKPIQELRLGLAFHTPTWYNLTESYGANVNYSYDEGFFNGSANTNNGMLGYNYVNFRSPMKLIASVAGVIGNNFIISFDYEWSPYNKMRYSVSNNGYYGYYDYDYPDFWPYSGLGSKTQTRAGSIFESSDPYYETNNDIASYYKSTNSFRIGAEYRINSAFSLRAGYANVSSPVKTQAKNNQLDIFTSGTLPSYRFDNQTNYITCGAGWKYKYFYIDLAYVYKHMSSKYHAYTNDILDIASPSPQAEVSFKNSQIVLSAGFKF